MAKKPSKLEIKRALRDVKSLNPSERRKAAAALELAARRGLSTREVQKLTRKFIKEADDDISPSEGRAIRKKFLGLF